MSNRLSLPTPSNHPPPWGIQEQIVEQLKKEICQGILKPGGKLPTRMELIQTYHTTPVTIQRAFNKLKQEGWIYSKRKKGTFIVDHPPCFSHYALVFPGEITSEGIHSNFSQVLLEVAQDLEKSTQKHFKIYKNLNGHIDEPDYQRLWNDVEKGLLAGIIFTSHPYLIAETPLFQQLLPQSSLPIVAFMSRKVYDRVPVVTTNFDTVIPSIFSRLVTMEIQEVYVIATLSGNYPYGKIFLEEAICREATFHGLEIPEHHFQVMHASIAPRARQLTRLMMDLIGNQRIGLLILDDCLVSHAVKGIWEAGKEKYQHVEIFAYANFPRIPELPLPVTFFGLDVRKVLASLLEILDNQRQKKTFSDVLSIPIEFL